MSEDEFKKRIDSLKPRLYGDFTEGKSKLQIDLENIVEDAKKEFPDPHDDKFRTVENEDDKDITNPWLVIEAFKQWGQRWLGDKR